MASPQSVAKGSGAWWRLWFLRKLREKGCHVIGCLAPIGKVSAIITHISGKVGTLKVKPALLICSGAQWPKVPELEFVFQTHRAWIIISFRHCGDNGNFLSFLMVEECSWGRKEQSSSSTASALFQTFMYIQRDRIKLQVEGHIVLPSAGRSIPSLQFNAFQMWPDPLIVAMPT